MVSHGKMYEIIREQGLLRLRLLRLTYVRKCKCIDNLLGTAQGEHLPSSFLIGISPMFPSMALKIVNEIFILSICRVT